MPHRLFSDRSHYTRGERTDLAEVLRPFWKDAPFGEEQRREMYGVSSDDFWVVNKLEEADAAVLPMTWNHYVKRGQVGDAASFIKSSRNANRPVLSYVSGDEGVAVPQEFEDVYVVRASGLKSRRRKRQIAQPVFFDDPARNHPDLFSIEPSAKNGRRPAVGFCGQASVSVLKSAWDILRECARHASHRFGMRMEEPQPLYPSSLLRARALGILRNSSIVNVKFIVRSRYRAGIDGAESRERTTREFYANMADTDYTLCSRGGGNFSKRFYETLAMARIPVLIDTDCLLPFESVLPWDAHIVRVPVEDLNSAPQRIASHFSMAGNGPGSRMLWENWLSFGGFHRQLLRLIVNQATKGEQI